jgi:hypothetical protein
MGLDAPVRAELSGRDGKPIAVHQTDDVSRLTDLQLHERMAECLKAIGASRQTTEAPPEAPAPEDDNCARYAEALAERERSRNGNAH